MAVLGFPQGNQRRPKRIHTYIYMSKCVCVASLSLLNKLIYNGQQMKRVAAIKIICEKKYFSCVCHLMHLYTVLFAFYLPILFYYLTLLNKTAATPYCVTIKPQFAHQTKHFIVILLQRRCSRFKQMVKTIHIMLYGACMT